MENDILRMIYNLMKFPFPQICRHLVATDLLSLLEKHGHPVSPELAKAVVQADDLTAIRLLQCGEP
jgi:hypothetical protein